MTRDLTEQQKGRVTYGYCPKCNGRGFRIGPQGGAAINVECVSEPCRKRFNVVMFGGRCLFAEEIPSEREGGSSWPIDTDGRDRGHKGTRS